MSNIDNLNSDQKVVLYKGYLKNEFIHSLTEVVIKSILKHKVTESSPEERESLKVSMKFVIEAIAESCFTFRDSLLDVDIRKLDGNFEQFKNI